MIKTAVLAAAATLALAGCGADYITNIPASTTPQVLLIEQQGSLDARDFKRACGYTSVPYDSKYLNDWQEEHSAAVVKCKPR